MNENVRCRDCLWYDAQWMRGWAAGGKILKRREGVCHAFSLVVREDALKDCELFKEKAVMAR